LGGGLAVLEPAGRGDRSTAVRATVEWSRRLLDPDAQRLFDRVAVCRGGFVPDVVERLAPAHRRADAAALPAELVEASLVVAGWTGDPRRYGLSGRRRPVALGHLSPRDLDDAHTVLATWMQDVARAIDDAQAKRTPDASALLRRELVNLRDALVWLTGNGR